jgi:acetyl-CoA acetyltransferase family protein
MQSVGDCSRAIRTGETAIMMAGGVESMSRSPFVMAKADAAFSRNVQMFDTTMGWRFINPLLKEQYGVHSMPETAENVAEEFDISREDQDRFALLSQQKTERAQANEFHATEITPVSIPRRKQDPLIFDQDEHPRQTSMDALAKLGTPFREDGTVTAGNASGINDGACALLLASEQACSEHNLTPRAEVIAMATAGLEPRLMGMGPVNATRKLMKLTGMTLSDMHTIELNEAFAAQSLACLRELDLDDEDPRVNPNGGAIALGHPLGMSGARLITTAINQLEHIDGEHALCTMCIGVGQGIAILIRRV